MRGYIERQNVIDGAALNLSGQTQFSKEFPMGEGWFAMFVYINIAVVIGTGAGPVAEGELLFVKNVLVRTDRGEILCNLPGRALYKLATMKNGATPAKDAIAAASATYRVCLPIYFCDPEGAHSMIRPEDTILDTSRYNSISSQVTLGSVSDLFTAPGTATATATLDVEVERTFGVLPGDAPGKGGRPIGYKNYDVRPPVDANTTQAIDIERSSDLNLARLYFHTSSSGTGGVPWSGTNSDNRVAVMTVKDQSRFIEKDRRFRHVQAQNKLDCGLESNLTGVACFNFVKDRSHGSALATADKSVLQLTWTNDTAAANNICTLTQEGIRKLK